MNLQKCNDCDRPVAPYSICPWCGTLALPPPKQLFSLIFYSLIAFIFTPLCYYFSIPPVQNQYFAATLGFCLGCISAMLFKAKPHFIGIIPLGITYAIFLKTAVFRTICIHMPYIIFLFAIALFVNSLKKKAAPYGSIQKRLISSYLLWIPFLWISCLYTDLQGALVIPVIISILALLLILFSMATTPISFFSVAVLTGFALIYFNFFAYTIGFIIITIVKQFHKNSMTTDNL